MNNCFNLFCVPSKHSQSISSPHQTKLLKSHDLHCSEKQLQLKLIVFSQGRPSNTFFESPTISMILTKKKRNFFGKNKNCLRL